MIIIPKSNNPAAMYAAVVKSMIVATGSLICCIKYNIISIIYLI